MKIFSRLGGGVLVTALAAIAVAVAAEPASAAVPGLQRVTVSSVSDSVSFKEATAVCPAGKQVVGAEFSISGGIGSVVLDDLVPSATSVRVGAREDANGTTDNWLVRATAMCANPLAGYEINVVSSVSNSAGKSAAANCSAGKQLLGSGAFINGGFGEVVIDALIPRINGMSVTAFEGDNGGTANNWTVTALAICANPLPGQQVVFATSASSSSAKIQDVVCPAGTQVLSAGLDIFGATGEVTVIGMFTSLLDREASVGALEDDNGTDLSWTARAFAVCATP